MAVALLGMAMMLGSCMKGFLDIVPDNVPTLDHAFATRLEAEKYLFTCYAYLPQEGHPDKTPLSAVVMRHGPIGP